MNEDGVYEKLHGHLDRVEGNLKYQGQIVPPCLAEDEEEGRDYFQITRTYSMGALGRDLELDVSVRLNTSPEE